MHSCYLTKMLKVVASLCWHAYTTHISSHVDYYNSLSALLNFSLSPHSLSRVPEFEAQLFS